MLKWFQHLFEHSISNLITHSQKISITNTKGTATTLAQTIDSTNHPPETLEECLSILLPQWNKQNLECVPPVSSDEIRRIFTELGSKATSDVVLLYSTVGGMGMMDNEMWTLWDFWTLKHENIQHSASVGSVLFADFLMSSWQYRLKPNADDTSSVYLELAENNTILIASSLLTFFQAYLTNASQLLQPSTLMNLKN
jgi:hypothetical protein